MGTTRSPTSPPDRAQLALQGPRSRQLLAALTDTDLSTDAYPFRTAREIDVAGVGVLCTRITYVGELGYELYVPAARALEVYDALRAGGAAPVGLSALGSLRMEKGYRDFGHDIDNTDDPVSVGLGFALALGGHNRPHVGRTHQETDRASPSSATTSGTKLSFRSSP